MAALGGRGGGAPGDTGLLTYATRYGVAPDIRATLAVDDLEFRRANDGLLLERAFNVNVYYRSYASQSLDRYRELERFRAAGVPTPAVSAAPDRRVALTKRWGGVEPALDRRT